MKNLLMALLVMCGIMLAALTLTADTETVGDYTWTYQIYGNTAEICSDSYDDPAVSPKPTGAVMIPSALGGYPVTSIGDEAFSRCSGLTSVTIPDSVTNIGAQAFCNCSGLTSVTIPDSVTGIGHSAFSGCSGLEEITLPFVGAQRGNSLSYDSVFGYIFDDSSYSGGEWAGQSYSPNYSRGYYIPYKLKKVVITDETILGYGAFSGCQRLTSVTIPDSVTNIGQRAFSNCQRLTNVTIGNGVTSIGPEAFFGCSVAAVHISDLAAWCRIPFGSGSDTPFFNNGGKLYFNGSLVTDLTIPDSVTSIGNYAFCNCSSLTSVTIPNSVTNIGNYAFYHCTGLTSVTIPNSVTSIGNEAFNCCTGLTSVTIPNSVTNIGYNAFYGCSGLASVTIPNSVTSIGNEAFSRCTGLTSVTIGNGVTSIGNEAFGRCGGLISVTIPDSVTNIGQRAFRECSGLTSITIPDSVTSMASDAFDGCTRLWTEWYKTLANVSAAGGGASSAAATVVQQVEAPYALTESPADRAIASVTVDGDCAIDSFVLKDGKVYDSILHIVNTAEVPVAVTLPEGYTYETFKGASPLTIPASSRSILTITRMSPDTFLVTREELVTVQ